MSLKICRFSGCNNPQPLENLRVNPNLSTQEGGTCPNCKKFSWLPVDGNETKRPASQKDCKGFLERNNITRCCFCGIEKNNLPESSPLWQDEFWVNNSHGEYYAAAFFENVIQDALNYLSSLPKIDASPAIAKPINKTIICQKGKVKRKVIAFKPKCPVGFKKK